MLSSLQLLAYHSNFLSFCNYFHSQAAQDGVDIISLSITPNRRPPGLATFFNPIDMSLLAAVKAGIFVVQAAGNTGPAPKSMSSFSPWIFTVGASSHDRIYNNYLVLGNNLTISGVGLARKFGFSFQFQMINKKVVFFCIIFFSSFHFTWACFVSNSLHLS